MSSSAHPPSSEASILSSYLLPPSSLPQIIPYSQFVATCVPANFRNHPYIKHLYRDLQFQRDVDVDVVRESIERESTKAGVLKGRLAASISAESSNQLNSGKKRKRQQNLSKPASENSVRPASSHLTESNDAEHISSDEQEFIDPQDRQVTNTLHSTLLHPAANSLTVKSTGLTLTPSLFHHNTDTLLDTMQNSVSAIEHEISDLESQNHIVLEAVQETIAQLSDLQYGRFSKLTKGSSIQDREDNSIEEDVIDALQNLEMVVSRAVRTR